MLYYLLFLFIFVILAFSKISIKIINYLDENSFQIKYLVFTIDFNYEGLKAEINKFKTKKIPLKEIKNIVSLNPLFMDLIRKSRIDKINVIKYNSLNKNTFIYNIITTNSILNSLYFFMKNKLLKFDEYKFKNIISNDRDDFDFEVYFSIRGYQILLVLIKNIKKVFNFFKKGKVLNGS